MGKDVDELIKHVLEKTESVYIPTGKVTWRLSTGVPSLDKVLGGGLPGGSIVQIYGPEKVGKTTLAYHIAAQAVKAGHSTMFVALEKYSDNYARACGVDVDAENFHLVAADFAEQIFNLCIEATRNYDVKVIIMDSIAAAIPKQNIDKKQVTNKDLDKGVAPGTQARAVGMFVQQLQQPIRRKETLFVCINQLRSDIGRFTSGLKPSGGLALQYFSDIKISMWGRHDRDKQETETTVRVDKGKDWDVVTFGATTLWLHHAKGVDIERDIVNVCEKSGVVKRSGSWYTFGEHRFQGMENFANGLRDDSALREELYNLAVQANVEVEQIEDESEENANAE